MRLGWKGTAVLSLACCSAASHAQSALPDSPRSAGLDLHRFALPAASRPGFAGGAFAMSASPSPLTTAQPVAPKQADLTPDDVEATRYKGSTYVPVDSWVYPALERLAALGYIQTGSLTIRPITRIESARLVSEAHVLFSGGEQLDGDLQAGSLLAALDDEFAEETRVTEGGANRGATVDSVYARFNGISGDPLRDSFHFGQTIYDDFGRPYGKGANAIAGFSGHAERGPFAVYVRGEYQHGASSPAYSAAAQQTIVAFDQLTEAWTLPQGAPAPPAFNFNPASASKPRFVEAYVAVNLANWQISAGQQSLWWGPTRSTSLILSNNAAAMPMIRIGRSVPAHLPGFLDNLGPLHFDAFLARQGGIHYVGLGQTFLLHGSQTSALTPPPYLWGLTLSIEPTKNLELAFAHTVIFAGYGRPLNLRTFAHSFSVSGNDQVDDPGKRVTEFSVSYHIPGLGHELIASTEAMAWDNPVQGHFTSRYALTPGVYLPQIPGVKKLDLRLEGVYTDLPGLSEEGYYYANAHYPQGYTNYGQILGSWIGREGRGGAGTSTYWFSPRTKAAVTFRKMVANPIMLQGGNLTDVSASFTWLLRPGIEFSTVQQYEKWRFPILNADPRSNFSTTFQVQLLNKPRL